MPLYSKDTQKNNLSLSGVANGTHPLKVVIVPGPRFLTSTIGHSNPVSGAINTLTCGVDGTQACIGAQSSDAHERGVECKDCNGVEKGEVVKQVVACVLLIRSG